MSATLGLMRLQQVDTKLDQLEAELQGILAELSNDESVRAAQSEFDSAARALEVAEGGRDEAETQATSINNKMQQAESSLYGGGVRNPKELQDLQAEVGSLRKHLTTIEESELQWMEQVEAAEFGMTAARDRLSTILSQAQAITGRLSARRAELLDAREDLDSARKAAAAAVNAEHLAIYEKLRQGRRGLAVSSIGDDACSACGTTLTAALQQAARHSLQLVHCPSCGRILYAD